MSEHGRITTRDPKQIEMPFGTPVVHAHDILISASDHLRDRATTYDSAGGERSIPAVVTAFNEITGHKLSAEQGWLFMALVKLVRTQQGAYKGDNYEDGAAYIALMGEQANSDRGNV